ncbi:hypothetical protein [Deinococcus sp. Leaf326]|uniref:hypothetical protein n=1 Tax=Deinococcus sp. Leaf326 TaxID=1736338 RepID=UPI0006FC5D8F|nr:hypothetical protein [Deinococcus sp. Leaf326]KQR27278.1 hypothetical protein ASF71_17820 [Deinococcus sp. Leaf326]
MKERFDAPEQFEAAYQAGQYDRLLTALRHQEGLTARELAWVGISLLRTGQFVAAEEPLELAVALGDQEAAVEFGNLLRATGRSRKAAEHFQALLPHLSGELKFRTLRWFGVTLDQLGEAGAVRAIEEARRGYLALGDRRMAARLTHTLAASHSTHGEFTAALKLLSSAIPLLEQDRNPRPLLAAFHTLIDVQVECGQLDEAAHTLERARQLNQTLHDPHVALHLDARQANLMLMQGDYGGYAALLGGLADRAQAVQDSQILEYALSRLADHQSRTGEHVEAVRTLGQLRAQVRDLSLYSRLVIAMMTLRRGDAPGALRLQLEVRRAALEQGSVLEATRALLLAAYSAYSMNDLPRCADLLAEALLELAGHPRPQSWATIGPELRELEEMLTYARLQPNLAPLLQAALEDASHLGGSLRDDLFTAALRLEIMTLGQELALRDGVPCAMRTRGSVAVLCYLALHPRSTRQEIITALWPERDPKKAANYFRQCVADIRESVGADVVLVEGAHQAPEYRLSGKASVVLDSQRVLQLVASGQLHAAVAAYKGEFLPGLEESEWADDQRLLLRGTLASALRAELRAAQLAGEKRRVVLLAGAVLNVDPDDFGTEELRLSVAREVSSPAELARFEAERHRRMN